MRVLVTGASGFVGSHAVHALVEAGHEVRASGRSAERVRATLESLGVGEDAEAVAAEVRDPESVRRALLGCDAVIHAAGGYTHDARRARDLLEVNPRGASVVLGEACRMGLDPVVHVSSYVALLPSSGPLGPDSPVGDPPTPYALSKARADAVARTLQADGGPVAIVYPGMVWGPGDPYGGESVRLARSLLARRVPMSIPGAVPVTDVRDLAAVFAAIISAGPLGADPDPSRHRYLAASELVPMTDLMAMICRAGGVRPPRHTMSARAALAAGHLADLFQRLTPFRLSFNSQAPWTALHGVPMNTDSTRAALDLTFRPPEQTFEDTVAWLQSEATANARTAHQWRRSGALGGRPDGCRSPTSARRA